ncbi:MAG: ATP-binding protein [Candidatus Rokubacteria bacterium]|nr:ATP-binding protein [Candidatus Rokubacteria bacterium]
MPDRSSEIVRDRAIRLFTFLRELTELRTKTILSWEQYEQVVWFHDIPRESGCHCIAWPSVDLDEHAEAWVEVKKPRLKAPPKPPPVVIPWIDVNQIGDSTQGSPQIREQITVEEASKRDDGIEELITHVQQLSEHREVWSAWQGYLAEQWTPWAEEDRRLQRVQAVYTDLFTVYQRQQRLGEAFEVVVGLGHLTWSRQSVAVKRHLITAHTSISFDSNRGVITVGPAGEGARPSLEQDMLEPSERPNTIEQRAIEEQVNAIGDSLWDRTQVQAALRSWVNAVSTEGQFENSLDRQSEVGRTPIVHLAPAVILRRRTEQSFLRLFQEIIGQLRAGEEVPLGVHRLVEIIDDRPQGAVGGDAAPAPAWSPHEIYFPLPANEEQIDRFRSDVSLSEIADLCVILLGDDLDAIEALEDSVRGITRRFKEWNPRHQDRVIADLERRLDEARRTEAATLAKLRALREVETHQHVLGFGGYHGTAQSIAMRVRREEDEYGWAANTDVSDAEPALTDSEALEFLRLLRGISAGRQQELLASWPTRDDLLTPEAFVALPAAERRAKEAYREAEAQRTHAAYATLVQVPKDLRDALGNALEDLRVALDTLLGRGERWIGEAARQILSGRSRPWAELASETRRHLIQAAEKARRASGRRIVGLNTQDRALAKQHAIVLLKHFESGGSLWFSLLLPRSVREARYLAKSVTVDGRRCDRPLPLRQLIEWIESTERLETLRELWSRHVEPVRGSFAEQVAVFEDLEDALRQLLELEKKQTAVRSRQALIPGMADPVWHDLEHLRALEGSIQAVSAEEELRRAQASLSTVETTLRVALIAASAHPVVSQMLKAVDDRDERGWGEGWATLATLQADREILRRREDLLGRLRHQTPKLADLLQEDFASSSWDTRLQHFNAAWDWARANRWLRRQVEGSGVDILSRDLAAQGQRVRELVRDLAAARAWKHCFAPERFTEEVRQHLEAWTKAVARIGKGTGKYAGQHRKAARDHMERCRAAIPAWIMPLYRVAEAVRPGVDMYDVVIVDEASQSGPEALFLHYLAKRMVVVGDDKQISPEFVGLDRQDVELLRQRHLTDIPHDDALGVDNSFFDQAEIRFGGRIRLREHFRCMPEIIQFSNNLCYRSEPLVPLRQYGRSRLPPVVVHLVPDGYETGRTPKLVNRPEAEAIAVRIEACLRDPAYAPSRWGLSAFSARDRRERSNGSYWIASARKRWKSGN